MLLPDTSKYNPLCLKSQWGLQFYNICCLKAVKFRYRIDHVSDLYRGAWLYYFRNYVRLGQFRYDFSDESKKESAYLGVNKFIFYKHTTYFCPYESKWCKIVDIYLYFDSSSRLRIALHVLIKRNSKYSQQLLKRMSWVSSKNYK